jgi:hypothetical protein
MTVVCLPTPDDIAAAVILFDGDLYDLSRPPRPPIGRDIHDWLLAAHPDELMAELALHALSLEEQLATEREIRRALLTMLHRRSGRVE